MAARLSLNVSSAELLRRIRADYLEMPGLRLTAPQAPCLFGLDSEAWDAGALLDAKFLSRTHNGLFAMAATQLSDGPDFRNRRRQERTSCG